MIFLEKVEFTKDDYLNLVLYLCSDTFEKLIQIENLINSYEYIKLSRNLPSISIYNESIDQVYRNISFIFNELLTFANSKEEVDVNQVIQFLSRIRNLQDTILFFHNSLGILTGKLEIPIIYDFLRKIQLENPKIEQQNFYFWVNNFSITLIEDYNFLDLDLFENFENKLLEKKIEFNYGISNKHIIGLPIIEANNPLMWTIIGHEIGHFLISSLSLGNTFSHHFLNENNILEDDKPIYYKWFNEVLSDFLAIRYIGPAYYASIITMGLFVKPNHHTSYPSFHDRFGLLFKYLEKIYPKWDFEINDSKYPDFFYKSFLEYFYKISLTYQHLCTVRIKNSKDRNFYHPSMTISDYKGQMPTVDDLDNVLNQSYAPKPILFNNEEIDHLLAKYHDLIPICTLNRHSKEDLTKLIDKCTNSDLFYKNFEAHEDIIPISLALLAGWIEKTFPNSLELWNYIINGESIENIRTKYLEKIKNRNNLYLRVVNSSTNMHLYWGF
jgi:hypothetical protein